MKLSIQKIKPIHKLGFINVRYLEEQTYYSNVN